MSLVSSDGEEKPLGVRDFSLPPWGPPPPGISPRSPAPRSFFPPRGALGRFDRNAKIRINRPAGAAHFIIHSSYHHPASTLHSTGLVCLSFYAEDWIHGGFTSNDGDEQQQQKSCSSSSKSWRTQIRTKEQAQSRQAEADLASRSCHGTSNHATLQNNTTR